MKKLWLLSALSLSCLGANAQWTTSSPNTYFNLTGTVGVGVTSNFQGKLHVGGGITSTLADAAGDAANVLLLNPNAASTIADKRAGIWLDNDGRLKFRSTTSYGFGFRSQSNSFDIMNINDNGLSVGLQTPTTKLTVASPLMSSLVGVYTVADFMSNSSSVDRARISITNNFNNSSKASSASIVFAGYNYAGTGVENKWEIGTDLFRNGGRDFYFFNTNTGAAQVGFAGNGNVGISSATPISLFQVEDGAGKFSAGEADGAGLNYGTSYIGFNAARSGTNWTLNSDGLHNGGGVIYGDIYGNLNFSTLENSGNTDRTLSDANVKAGIAFQITANGITRAKTIKVETANWPDYVFKRNYHLPSLTAVASYININGHLPEVPSASEMVNNGLDVGEMNKLLMKKVEELTLYLIDIEKQNSLRKADFEKVILSQQKQINSLSSKLDMLKTKLR